MIVESLKSIIASVTSSSSMSASTLNALQISIELFSPTFFKICE